MDISKNQWKSTGGKDNRDKQYEKFVVHKLWMGRGIIKLEMSDIETSPFESSSRNTDEKMYVII